MNKDITAYVGFLLAGVIIGMLTCNSCKKTGGPSGSSDTTKVKVDTFYKQAKIDTVYVPKKDTQYVPVPHNVYHTDSFTAYEPLPDQADRETIMKYYNDLSDKYYDFNIYSDSQHTSFGAVYITDSITQNKIKSRHFVAMLKDTSTIKVITVTTPRRVVGYIDLGIMGSKTDPLYGASAGFALKDKKEFIYRANVNLIRVGHLYYGIGASIPIRLSKHR